MEMGMRRVARRLLLAKVGTRWAAEKTFKVQGSDGACPSPPAESWTEEDGAGAGATEADSHCKPGQVYTCERRPILGHGREYSAEKKRVSYAGSGDSSE
ncbi:hypothetical protein PHLCEN_2v174 [Hermanssonia centrifuga]|uniref:Uncharacterized protein n=1 Tax=Hermanssonia centrifuga TaxID=98765 RepID=A0A2R6S6R8_9APHY|nr:hypothetical protein PHLCEN_2v174 [Hermanssonia centrifuga]